MKIHRLVQMLGLINESGRLASDMYDLNNKTYYSEAEGKEIPISHMDFQHLVRAFVKQLAKEKTNHCNTVDIVKAKDSIINGLRSQVETLSSKVKDQDRGRVLRIKELNEKIEILEGIIEEKDETIQKLLDKPTWTEQPTNGHRYVFSEIPNNEYGKKLARGMKVFLNDESYTMRVRGQHLKPELYGTGKASYGQSIEDSTHLRIYIDKKKGE